MMLMSSSEGRAGLPPGKVARRHPAEPANPVTSPPADEGLVMLCVRVHPSLRRRLKLLSATSGRPLQSLAIDAFEAVCRAHDM